MNDCTTYCLENRGRKDVISIFITNRIPLTMQVVINTTFGTSRPYNYSLNIVKQHDNEHIRPMTHELLLTINKPEDREPLKVEIELHSKFINLEESSAIPNDVHTEFIIKKEEPDDDE